MITPIIIIDLIIFNSHSCSRSWSVVKGTKDAVNSHVAMQNRLQ